MLDHQGTLAQFFLLFGQRFGTPEPLAAQQGIFLMQLIAEGVGGAQAGDPPALPLLPNLAQPVKGGAPPFQARLACLEVGAPAVALRGPGDGLHRQLRLPAVEIAPQLQDLVETPPAVLHGFAECLLALLKTQGQGFELLGHGLTLPLPMLVGMDQPLPVL